MGRNQPLRHAAPAQGCPARALHRRPRLTTPDAEATPPTKWWDLRPRLARIWEQLKNEQATPERLGVAVGVGVFVGCSPLHGFQWILALALAWLLRLNKIAVMVGLQISIAPATPVIIFLSLQLGEMLLHHCWLPLSLSAIRALTRGEVVKTLLVDLVVGGLTLGTVLGLIAGIATTMVLRRRATRRAAASK